MAPGLQSKRLSKDLPYNYPQENEDVYPDSPRRFSKAETRGKASLDFLNENSPLLLPQRIEDDSSPIDSNTSVDELDFLDGEEQEESRSVWYLFVLTLCIGG